MSRSDSFNRVISLFYRNGSADADDISHRVRPWTIAPVRQRERKNRVGKFVGACFESPEFIVILKEG